MEQKDTIITEVKGSVATISLNRPGVYNAMDIAMIRELTEFIKSIDQRKNIRVVTINSIGKHFSVGADLNWMKAAMKQTPVQLNSESMELAGLFKGLWESESIILSAVQGKVMGGANGLVAASDIVIAEKTASFAFSDAKLGLVPATIAPFLVRKLGIGRSAELMLTGRSFDANEARESGYVQEVCEEGTLKQSTETIISKLLSNGPEAMKGIKHLLRWLESAPTSDQIQEYTASLIAERRISPEGQEGMQAFLEKRDPDWHETE